jgi:hypothetical protein
VGDREWRRAALPPFFFFFKETSHDFQHQRSVTRDLLQRKRENGAHSLNFSGRSCAKRDADCRLRNESPVAGHRSPGFS